MTANDLIDPGPARTILFWDQREDTINFGNFFVDMSGFPNKPQDCRFEWDLPGSYHNRAGGLSFADGHAEIKGSFVLRVGMTLRITIELLSRKAIRPLTAWSKSCVKVSAKAESIVDR